MARSLIDMITAATVRSHLAAAEPDVLLRPDLGTVGLLDFHRWDEAHDAGRDAARRAESRLVALTSSDPPL